MQFLYGYQIDGAHIEADVLRFVQFLRHHRVDALSNLKIDCYPWRNGKRLQAVNEQGRIRPVPFDLAPGDVRFVPPGCGDLRERLIIRERPDGLGARGLASLLDHDD